MADAVLDPRRSPGLGLGITSVPNLRDLGGYRARDGCVVRTGLVFRSGQLNPITAQDLELVALLHLKCDFDLRTAEEAAAAPDILPDSAERVWLNVFEDTRRGDLALLDAVFQNPMQANEMIGGGRIDRLREEAYRAFVSAPGARRAYARLFASLADPGRLPALFHCSAGKDRTGWAAAALLTLLGVPEDAVVEDYLRSNDCVLPYYRPLIEGFVAGGGEPGIATAMFAAKREYLEAAFDEMRQGHGTIERYFAEALGIGAGVQSELRAILLEPSAAACSA